MRFVGRGPARHPDARAGRCGRSIRPWRREPPDCWARETGRAPRLHPVAHILAARRRRHRLAPDERLEQRHVFIRKEEEGAIAAQRTAQSLRRVLQPQGQRTISGRIPEPVVGVGQLIADPVAGGSVELVGSRPGSRERPRRASARIPPRKSKSAPGTAPPHPARPANPGCRRRSPPAAPPGDCAGSPPAVTPMLALTPSTVKELVLGRWPVAVNCPASPRVAGTTLLPPANSNRLNTPPPFSGKRSIWSCSMLPPVEGSVRSRPARPTPP